MFRPISIGAILLGASLALAAYALTLHRHEASLSAEPVLLQTVGTDTALGRAANMEGSRESRFTLVEFADYDCEPCDLVRAEVKRLLSKHEGTLSFVFRNFPLRGIHPEAYSMAVAAEAAREQGKFSLAQAKLFKPTMLPHDDNRFAKDLGLDVSKLAASLKGSAKRVVDKDLEDGATCGVRGTPTFLLCCPGDQVYRLSSIRQVEPMLSRRFPE